jgi:hypothetical protein
MVNMNKMQQLFSDTDEHNHNLLLEGDFPYAVFIKDGVVEIQGITIDATSVFLRPDQLELYEKGNELHLFSSHKNSHYKVVPCFTLVSKQYKELYLNYFRRHLLQNTLTEYVNMLEGT